LNIDYDIEALLNFYSINKMEPLLNEKFSSNSDFFIESHEFEEM